MSDLDPADPPAILRDIWSKLERGVSSRKSAFHTPVLLTRGLDDLPAARTVVLREVDASARLLVCHTDCRSPKVGQIAREPRVGWLFYDASARTQLRIRATAWVHGDDEHAERGWARSRSFSRKCYRAAWSPGSVLASPADVRDAEHDGRINFSVVRTQVEQIEWLFLRAEGHLRLRFDFEPDGSVRHHWLQP